MVGRTTQPNALEELKKYNILPCIDVYPTKLFKDKSENIPSKAVFLKSAIWSPNVSNNIRITFGSYPCDNCSPDAAWSNIGSESNSEKPSMNLGFCDPPFGDFSVDGHTFKYSEYKNVFRNYCNGNQCVNGWKPGRTVLHEFGHAMGMFHEHQNDVTGDNPFEFDSQKVIDYYQNTLGYPPDQAKEVAYTNVIDRYECTKSNCPYAGSPFDKDSIMMYPIDPKWLKPNTNPSWVNIPHFEYSKTDREWLARMYPLDASPRPQINVEFLDGKDWQKYWVKKMVKEGLEPYVGVDFYFPQLGPAAPISAPSGISGPGLGKKEVAIIIASILGGIFLILVIVTIIGEIKHSRLPKTPSIYQW